jgi:hypothetical protein
VVFLILLAVGLDLFFTVFMLSRSQGSMLVYATKHPVLTFQCTGMALAIIGFSTIALKGVYCSKCKYRHAPDVPNADQCPECGNQWHLPGGLRQKKKLKSLRLGLAGTGLFLIGHTASLVAIKNQARLLTIVPTDSLIKQIHFHKGFLIHEWNELNSRSLTEEQMGVLAEGILDGENRSVRSQDADWLWKQCALGALPSDLEQRFYDNLIEAKLVVPDTARVGDVVNCQIEYDHVLLFTPRVHVLWKEKRSGKGYSRFDRERGVTVCRHPVRADLPGPMTVRVTCWVVLSSGGPFPKSFHWNEDGSPVLPDGYKVLTTIDLSHEIEVLPWAAARSADNVPDQ